MIFSELYSAYYNTVADILTKLVGGVTDEKELRQSVTAYAFGESALTILPSLKEQKWQLVRPDLSTPIRHKPTMPLTLLQKQWLKAISLDPRIRLFDISFDFLDDVEPLFTPEDYRVYDRYGDGDPYEDENYIRHFRLILSAIRERAPIKLDVTNRNGKNVYTKCLPVRLEYSEKDDKFRLITAGCHFMTTVNLAKITSCSRYNGPHTIRSDRRSVCYDTVTLRITDERNALERCMLHFAHFEKQAERLDEKHYLLHVRYDREDRAEMVIRILSFGPLVEVTAPKSFRDLIKQKLKSQKSCELK